MPIVRVQAILPRDTGLPEDVSVNTFHFLTLGAPEGAAGIDDIFAKLKAFYTSIQNLLGAVVAPPMLFKAYNLSDAPPRAPLAETTHPITPNTSSLVEEVAVCLSYHGPKASGLAQARRRGRIFIGPLAGSAGVTVANRVRFDSSFSTILKNAGAALRDASNAATEWKWVVYSPTTTLGAQTTNVTGGWVDDAFDTQRRRGPAPTGRMLF